MSAAGAPTFAQRLGAEALGTLLLVATVVGSGISAERLAGGNEALALLANCVATGAGLMVLILVFAPISGAHFNPAVTLVEATRGALPASTAAGYVAAQTAGAIFGVALAHGMFDLPILAASAHARAGCSQLLGEVVATFGLVLTILAVSRARPAAVPFAVGLYIMAGYWFTSSSSFANPAVTLARSLTPTFTGIRPVDVLGFAAAQLTGALGAAAVFRALWGQAPTAREARAVTQAASRAA